MLGTTPDQIAINDMIVNPISRKAYLSVSRGRGPDAAPVILRVDAAGKIEELSLENVKHAKVSLANAPAADAKDRRGNSLRVEAITDLHYVDGKVFLAGLSNEEFASKLRSVASRSPSPDAGTSVEIYHGAHGAVGDALAGAHVRALRDPEGIAPARRLHLHAAGEVPGQGPEAGLQARGHDDRGAGQPQPSAGHDRLQEGRRGVPADEQLQPRRDEDVHQGHRGPRARSPRPWRGRRGCPTRRSRTGRASSSSTSSTSGNALVLTRAESGALDLKTIALP